MTASRRRVRSAIAWAIAVASFVGMAANEVVGRTLGVNDGDEFALFLVSFLGAGAMGVVGALVASRTANPLGWILLAIPAGVAVAIVADTIVKHGAPRGYGYVPVASWLSTWPFLLSLTLPVAILFLFPTGTVPSPRWRWPWRIYIGAAAITVVGFAVLPTEDRAPDGTLPIENPFAIEAIEPILSPALALVSGIVVVSAFVGLASLVARYRSATAEGRQQLRWLSAVGAFGALLIVLLVATVTLTDPDRGTGAVIADAIVILLAADISIGVAAATAVAIFRYRLYDLNLVIRRAVVVATMAAAITAVYVAFVVAVPFLIRGRGGERIDLIPLLAAAVVAVAFDPLRRAARRLADRLVYGDRATPYEVLTAFGARVGDAYASEDVAPRMARILAEGTGAERGTVWLHVGGELRREAVWPGDDGRLDVALPLPADALPAIPDEHAIEVRHQGELLGALSVVMPASEPMDPSKEQLVRDLAAQAGLVLRNVRLIEELRASRQRLVAAQDEERRKLERNLHDGAQQQLVALAVQLKLTRTLVDRDPAKAGAMLEALQGSASAALEDLRDLARGIYPPLLADKGLAAALEAQARKAPIPVRIEPDGIGRYPQEVESAVYFSCLEALNNVAKYADATSAVVTLGEHDGVLSFSVRDDGRGFDAASTGYGTGLHGIADRLDAIGGRIEIRSTPGAGTSVSGHVATAEGAR